MSLSKFPSRNLFNADPLSSGSAVFLSPGLLPALTGCGISPRCCAWSTGGLSTFNETTLSVSIFTTSSLSLHFLRCLHNSVTTSSVIVSFIYYLFFEAFDYYSTVHLLHNNQYRTPSFHYFYPAME